MIQCFKYVPCQPYWQRVQCVPESGTHSNWQFSSFKIKSKPKVEQSILELFTTAQTFILNIVMMMLDSMDRGGHVLRGVTAHGSPGGPLQFDHLEAALATTFH